MKIKRVKVKNEGNREFLRFLAETSNKGNSMKDHPFNKQNSEALDNAREPYPKRSQVERQYIKRKYNAGKLLSGTGNTTAAVTPDGVSIIFQSVKHGYTIHWPASNWAELRNWLNLRLPEK